MLVLILLAKYTFIGDYFAPAQLQILIKEAGWFGWVIFFGVFLLGTLMNVPGAVFLVFAILTWGYIYGILLSYICALVAALINFLFARTVGGKALSEIENKRIRKVLDKIETNPIATICWLRVFMLLSPVINYTLALTNIKTKDFIIGNAFAMVFPFFVIIITTIAFRSAYFQQLISTWF
jgi:uncharacterized membrane protein YdjX (TVP38/TMEM64 family)